MKRLYFSCYILFSSFSLMLNAQSTIIKSFNSQNSFKESANGAIMTSDGGVIIAGTISDTSNQTQNGFLLKLDSSFNILWAKKYNSGGNCLINSIALADDNGFLLFGSTTTSLINPYGIYAIKTDSLGNIEWSKTFEGFMVLNSSKTSDNGYILTGQTIRSGPTGGNSVISLTKIDSLGNLMWSNSYGGTSSAGEVGVSVKQTLDNGYIVTGNTHSFGLDALFVLKVDSVGNLVWAKTYDGLFHEVGFDIVSTADSGFVVTGAGTANIAFSNTYASLIKMDKQGNVQWSKVYADTIGYAAGQGHKLIGTFDGGYAMLFEGSWFHNLLLKTDSLGKLDWVKRLGDIPNQGLICNGLFEITTGKYVAVSTTSTNYNDIFVAKVEASPDLCTTMMPTYFDSPFSPIVQNALFTEIPLFQQNTISTTATNFIFYDSLICLSNSPTSLIEVVSQVNSSIRIFPNPAHEVITVVSDLADNIIVSDLFGQVLIDKKIDLFYKHKLEIDVSRFSTGIYFIQVGNEVRKFVKE